MTNSSGAQGYDLFFSYSTKDQEAALNLVGEIESHGLKCWIAPRDIPTSKSWAGAIIEGLNESRVFLILLTESSNQSNQVLREVAVSYTHLTLPTICSV